MTARVVSVVGGGLAGCEAAVQLARRGHAVRLHEMRPARTTPAHQTDGLGELVCTNSFKSEDPRNAHGQLKREMAALCSVLLEASKATRVAAGAALAVDRALFSREMERLVASYDEIEVVREEVTAVPDGPTVIATGPLTSDALSGSLQDALVESALAFFDAIAPIVHRDSLNHEVVFAQGRWDQDADYLNCPFSEAEYYAFVESVRAADVYDGGHDWDQVPYFEGCLPVEVLASRGPDTLRFGPMRPLGLEDPRSGRRPFAVVQLRREDRSGQMWNLVGFQTRLRIGEQRRVFREIPGLEDAEFLRMGSIHRNAYVNAPRSLSPAGALPDRPDVFVAGQLTGVEGYTESAASGIVAGLNLSRVLRGEAPSLPPPTTMLGGLYRYLSEGDPEHFQPMNSNWGLVDPLPGRVRDKRRKREQLAARASTDFAEWLASMGLEDARVTDRAEGDLVPWHGGREEADESALVASEERT